MKYYVDGIQEPGKVNVVLDGRVQDVLLHEANQTTLAKLHKQGCPYVFILPSNIKSLKPKTVPAKKSRKK
jgi:hypothetical protein